MFKILEKQVLTESPVIFRMVVEAPRIAKSCEPGQFLIVRADKDGERVPLTICDYDREKGTIEIVVQVIGAETDKMSRLEAGDGFADVVGPLGKPSDLLELPVDELKKKKILFVAGGVGTAPVYPQAKWLHDHGVDCDVIIGAKNKDLVIMEEKFRDVCNLTITTDDGSYGRSGMVTVALQDLWNDGVRWDHCVAIGPMIMMKFVCKLTKELGIHTVVSMNPIMVDGTGMCGACRLTVDGKVRFACVDGPEFDGHLVDFDQAMARMKLYRTEEGRLFLREKEGASHHGGCGNCD